MCGILFNMEGVTHANTTGYPMEAEGLETDRTCEVWKPGLERGPAGCARTSESLASSRTVAFWAEAKVGG